jgi:hypothetical protein
MPFIHSQPVLVTNSIHRARNMMGGAGGAPGGAPGAGRGRGA